MATQGLVTVVKDGQVVMKIVAGNDGDKAQELAHHLKESWPLTATEAHDLALAVGFGEGGESLVTITADTVVEPEYMDYDEFVEVHPLYASTFDQPEFNPRWESGLSECYVRVEV